MILQKLADQEANFAAPTSSNETTVFVRNIPYEVRTALLQPVVIVVFVVLEVEMVVVKGASSP